jgi:hypothetical protein
MFQVEHIITAALPDDSAFWLITTLVLLALLVQKEILGWRDDLDAQRTSRVLTIAILPLALVLVVNVIVETIAVLS